MSLELPGWVVNIFWIIGLPWPGIDEDQRSPPSMESRIIYSDVIYFDRDGKVVRN